MALTLLSDPVDGTTILTESLWETEFNNIYNNSLSLISPLTGNLAFGGFRATGLALGSVSDPSVQWTGDTNTGHYSRTADTLNGAAGGVLAYEFGITPIIALVPEGSRTNTVVTAEIRATTSGTPAAGIGTGILFTAESGDESPSNFGQIEAVASDVTAATEDTYFQLLLRVAGAALTSCYRFAATGAFNAIFTHANTAARTYTLQDSSDTIVGRATTDTLTNKTLSGAAVTGAAGATPSLNVLYTDTMIKGWVETSGAGAWTIDDDFNVDSITDNAAGDLTINWATAIGSGNYPVIGIAIGTTARAIREDTTTAKTTSLVRLNVFKTDDSVNTDPGTGISVMAIGG